MIPNHWWHFMLQVGSVAGNLMIKHTHREFPSDLFLILETAGAQVHIGNWKSSNKIIWNIYAYFLYWYKIYYLNTVSYEKWKLVAKKLAWIYWTS